MKKVCLVMCLIIVVLALCSCGSDKNKLVGCWVCEEINKGYPDQMSLNKDGTGTADGFTCNWSAKDGIFTLTVGSVFGGTYSYEYSIKSSKLYLDGYGYVKQ